MIEFQGNPINIVWLDLDDTLVNFKSASREALRRLYRDERLYRFFGGEYRWISTYEKVNYALWQQYAGAEVDQPTLRIERFRRPLVEADMAYDIATAMAVRMDTTYLDYLVEATELMPGAMELMEWFADKGVRVGVLSNGFADVQARKLRATGLDEFVELMVLSDEIGINKPDSRLFAHAMRRAGENSPENMLMIGDNATTDIAGAVGAGWHAILLDCQLPLITTRACGYSIVSSLDAIPSLLTPL